MGKVASGKAHPDTDVRLKTLNEYVSANYPPLPVRAPNGRILAKQVKGLTTVIKLPVIRAHDRSANSGERVSEMLNNYLLAVSQAQQAQQSNAKPARRRRYRRCPRRVPARWFRSIRSRAKSFPFKWRFRWTARR